MTSLPCVAARRIVPPALALLSSLTLAIPAWCAQPAAAEFLQPVEELVELDEVKVRGKLVANAVITAENRVFRLYNKLNQNDRYDVHCGDVRIRDSLALLRVCVPEFLASYADSTPVPSSFNIGWGFDRMSACGGTRSGVDQNGNMYHMPACLSTQYTSTYGLLPTRRSFVSSAVAAPPVPAETINEYKQNMLRVFNSDPALHDMATELAGMYREVDRIQARYAALQEEGRAAQKARLAAARERARQHGRELRPPHPRAP